MGTKDTGVKAEGAKGTDGVAPHIGNNGNWFVGTHDTGVKAQGAQGVQGEKGATGATGEKGKKGDTPYIGKDGFWYVGTKSLGVKAQGPQGEKGATGEKGEKGENAPKPNIRGGVWYIGDESTGIKAQGEKGDRGEQGIPGANGSKIYAGDEAPKTTDGEVGDYYIDKHAKMFYGPKTATGWDLTTGVSLMVSISKKDYELSTDGKTLLKWKNVNTRFIDMNADPILKDVTKIANNAFYGAINGVGYMELTTIFIGDNVTEIGTNAFNSCYKLKSIDLPDGITQITEGAFANCVRLQQIDIPEGVTAIGKNAFSGCVRISSIVIPSEVNKIESNAFAGNTRLHSVFILNETAFAIDIKAFNQAGNLRNIYVPKEKVDAYKIKNPTYKDLIR